MLHHPCHLPSVRNLCRAVIPGQPTRIADLTTGFGIERRLVRHDLTTVSPLAALATSAPELTSANT